MALDCSTLNAAFTVCGLIKVNDKSDISLINVTTLRVQDNERAAISSWRLRDLVCDPRYCGRLSALDPFHGVTLDDCAGDRQWLMFAAETDWQRHFQNKNRPCWMRGRLKMKQ
jgi:hypothetical protein